MLRACGVDAHSAGNTGTPLIEMLPQLTKDSWAVVEVSSFQLEKAPTFKPKIAVLLSLLEDHQDYHPTLEQYWETKLKIFANQDEFDWGIINRDDGRVVQSVKSLVGPSGFYTSGKEWTEDAAVKELVGVCYNGEDFGYIFEGEEFEPILPKADIPLQGAHNKANLAAALGAVYVALEWELTGKEDQIADAIRNFQTLPHRLEVVGTKNGVTYVNDSQSTIPDASIAALQSFPMPVTLLLGGRAKIEAESYRALMKKVAELGAKIELFGEAAEMLESVALSMGVEKLQINREKTLAKALQNAKINVSPGATVVLSPACASFDQFKSYEDRGQTFRALVEELA